MNKWLKPLVLSNEVVALQPLSLAHTEELQEAVIDGQLWNLWYSSVPAPDEVENFIRQSLEGLEKDEMLPFAVVRKSDSKVVGSTRFLNADSKNRRLEIGHTWYSQSVQRTGVNTACKHLLLQYAFEQLSCIAVEFRTNFHNFQSRKAIERLGAKQDGILRNHRVDGQGVFRDTVVFSILDSEWPTVKRSLDFKMAMQY